MIHPTPFILILYTILGEFLSSVISDYLFAVAQSLYQKIIYSLNFDSTAKIS